MSVICHRQCCKLYKYSWEWIWIIQSTLCQLLREAKWQSVHYALIKGSIRAHRPYRRKSIFRPAQMHKSVMTKQQCSKEAPHLFSGSGIRFGIVLYKAAQIHRIKDPSGDDRLMTKEHNLILAFWELHKFCLLCLSVYKAQGLDT